jgi:hypothetical protein
MRNVMKVVTLKGVISPKMRVQSDTSKRMTITSRSKGMKITGKNIMVWNVTLKILLVSISTSWEFVLITKNVLRMENLCTSMGPMLVARLNVTLMTLLAKEMVDSWVYVGNMKSVPQMVISIAPREMMGMVMVMMMIKIFASTSI